MNDLQCGNTHTRARLHTLRHRWRVYEKLSLRVQFPERKWFGKLAKTGPGVFLCVYFHCFSKRACPLRCCARHTIEPNLAPPVPVASNAFRLFGREGSKNPEAHLLGEGVLKELTARKDELFSSTEMESDTVEMKWIEMEVNKGSCVCVGVCVCVDTSPDSWMKRQVEGHTGRNRALKLKRKPRWNRGKDLFQWLEIILLCYSRVVIRKMSAMCVCKGSQGGKLATQRKHPAVYIQHCEWGISSCVTVTAPNSQWLQGSQQSFQEGLVIYEENPTPYPFSPSSTVAHSTVEAISPEEGNIFYAQDVF